jgi:hypothetical protein
MDLEVADKNPINPKGQRDKYRRRHLQEDQPEAQGRQKDGNGLDRPMTG